MTTGITFTFGGLKITNDAQVEDVTGAPIPGLYAAGEMVGGLYLPQLRQRHRPDVRRGLRPHRRPHRRGVCARVEPLSPLQ